VVVQRELAVVRTAIYAAAPVLVAILSGIACLSLWMAVGAVMSSSVLL
jgi:hypothetical protein